MHKVGNITCSWCHGQQSVVNVLQSSADTKYHPCLCIHAYIHTCIQQQGAHRLGRSECVGCDDHALMLAAAANLHALSVSDVCSTLEKCTQANEKTARVAAAREYSSCQLQLHMPRYRGRSVRTGSALLSGTLSLTVLPFTASFSASSACMHQTACFTYLLSERLCDHMRTSRLAAQKQLMFGAAIQT